LSSAQYDLPCQATSIHGLEQLVHPAVPQHVQIVDAVRATGHPGHDRDGLRRRVGPLRRSDCHVLTDQAVQVSPLSQSQRRNQTAIRDHMLIVKDRVSLLSRVRESHLRGAFLNWLIEA
jgi:hypothetical protein